MEIHLVGEDFDQALELSRASLERFASVRGYYRNTSNSHLVGKLGELAAESWFRELGHEVVSLFRDPSLEADADIIFKEFRVEVKTWSAQYWARWGRCVAIGQLPALRRKSDILLWCTVLFDEPRRTSVVDIRGWNYTAEIGSWEQLWTGPAGRQVHNHQGLESDLRDLDDFPPETS